MPTQYTTRAEIPHPQGGDAAVVHSDIEALVEKIDESFAMYSSGLRSARPSAGVDGRIYRQTDVSAGYPAGTLWFDNGSAWSLLFDPNGTHGMPTGTVVDFAGTAGQVPTGWVACDGAAVTAAANPLLRQFLIDAGSPYGTSGSDPKTPDYRGRVGVGLDDMGSGDAGRLDVTNTLGGTGGAQTHQLVSGEMPAHSHPVTVNSGTTGITAASVSAGSHSHTGTTSANGDHTHVAWTDTHGGHSHNVDPTYGSSVVAGTNASSAYGGNQIANGSASRWLYDTDLQAATGGSHSHSVGMNGPGNHQHTFGTSTDGAHTHTINVTDGGHSHTASSSNTGGGGAHNNMQPYVLVRKIIKA